MADLIEAVALAQAFAEGRLDPVAVTESCLERIAREDGRIRSFITVAAETARTEAAASRTRWARGRALGPLDGVPIALKDNIDVAGLPATAGTAAFRERVPDADARVAGRLRAQGAVILGKLNMHEGALGATNDNPVYGRCINPLMDGATPGGSSGGSGAAVAAGFCSAALGTDTMGSVRVPAAYCGIFGFKPSNGAISTEGVVPLSITLDSVGPLARTPEDLVLMAQALFETPSDLPIAPMAREVLPELSQLRIGIPTQLAEIELEPIVRDRFQASLAMLKDAGAKVVPVDVPAWHPSKARRAGLLVAEAEGARYYEAALGPDFPGLSPGFAAMLRYPAQAGLSRVVAAYELIETVRVGCIRALADVDVLALPTAPQTAFSHDMVTPINQADCTALANFARAPAVSIPVGGDPLPVGLQLIGAPQQDRRLLAILLAIDPVIAPTRASVTKNAGGASP